MQPPEAPRIARLLAEIAAVQDKCRRYGAAVYGLPPAQTALLQRAATGKSVAPGKLLQAIDAGERLRTKLGWDALLALGRKIHGPDYPFPVSR